VVESDMPVN